MAVVREDRASAVAYAIYNVFRYIRQRYSIAIGLLRSNQDGLAVGTNSATGSSVQPEPFGSIFVIDVPALHWHAALQLSA